MPYNAVVGDVFSDIRGLVDIGEYRDDLPGLAGVNLEDAEAIQYSPDGTARRMYVRGSDEFLMARERGLIQRLPPLTVASPEDMQEAEALVGMPLPALLCRLYLEVSNGGFGPGYGVLGLEHGHRDAGRTAVDLYKIRAERWPTSPPSLFPLCHWGCGIYSLVDCSSPQATVWGFDPNPMPEEELDHALFCQNITLEEWFRRWIFGHLYGPCAVRDPSTGTWRGATDDEITDWTSEI